MKKLVFTLILCYFFVATSVFGQQWNGASNSTNIIHRDGRVGIGNTNPDALLHIKTFTTPPGFDIIDGSYIPGSTLPNLTLQYYDSDIQQNYHWDMTASVSKLYFHRRIGNGAATSLLELEPNNLIYRGNRITVATAEKRFNLGNQPAPTGNSGQYLAFGANPLSGGWKFTGNSTNNGGAVIHGDDHGNLFFITRSINASNNMTPAQTLNKVRLRIHGDGKISIGTGNTLPDLNENGDGYLLFVKGGTLSEEVAVKTGWADYVFDKDYPLLPLEAVEQHIDIYGHLHNTPSAADLNGTVNLGDATVQQQEKIEEIYLHLIEMDKRVKALEMENKRLKMEIEELK